MLLSLLSDRKQLNTLPFFAEKQGQKPKGYWLDIENRKQFFAKLAQQQGFDPLVAENWDRITQSQVLEVEVCNI